MSKNEKAITSSDIQKYFLGSGFDPRKKSMTVIANDPFEDKRFSFNIAKWIIEKGDGLEQYIFKTVKDFKSIYSTIDSHPAPFLSDRWAVQKRLIRERPRHFDITLKIEEVEQWNKEAIEFIDPRNYSEHGVERYDEVKDGKYIYTFYRIMTFEECQVPIIRNVFSYCIIGKSFGEYGDPPYFLVTRRRGELGIPRQYAAIIPDYMFCQDHALRNYKNTGMLSIDEMKPIKKVVDRILEEFKTYQESSQHNSLPEENLPRQE
jgi:hypothetical protein